jgi:hypothetical protein
MDAESQLRQTGLSMTDMYAIKEAINLIENNDTNTTSTANRTGNQEDEVPNGHLSIQGDSEVFDKLVEEGIIRSGEDSESQYD